MYICVCILLNNYYRTTRLGACPRAHQPSPNACIYTLPVAAAGLQCTNHKSHTHKKKGDLTTSQYSSFICSSLNTGFQSRREGTHKHIYTYIYIYDPRTLL